MQNMVQSLAAWVKHKITSRCAFVMFFAFGLVGLSSPTTADNKAASFTKTIENFKSTAVGRQFFDSSYAYAVFPTIGKAGVGLGGAFGKGRVFVKGKLVGKATVTQVSIGLQLGGQAYSQILFIKDQRAFDEFTSGNFEVEAGLSAVAVNAHLGAQAGTSGSSASSGLHPSETEQMKTDYYKGLAVLSAGKGGLMYEASVAGQKYSFQPSGPARRAY